MKACVLVFVEKNPDVVFREKKYSESCWTHKIEDLLNLAGLKAARDAEVSVNQVFGLNWQKAKDWDPQTRYRQVSQFEAEKLLDALREANNGVLQWIKVHW